MYQFCCPLFLKWILVFLILQRGVLRAVADPYRSECIREAIFSSKQEDYVLQNHIIKTLQLGHVTGCAVACLEQAPCKSFNFEDNQESLKMCELSDSTKTESSGDFISRPGYTYYDTGDTKGNGPTCASSPCPHGEICVETCTPPSYFCKKVFPDSCKKIKEFGLSNGDGEYLLYLQRPECSATAKVYCADMDSDTPTEYVTLPAGKSVNFGFNNRPYGVGTHLHGKTGFNKIRLQLPARSVDRADLRFAVRMAGNVNYDYGVAGDCLYNSRCTYSSSVIGITKADLTGTDFKFPNPIPYRVGAWPSCAKRLFSPTMSADRKKWSVRCGGHCGSCNPTELILSVDVC